MSVKTCKQHANEPIFIYAQCAACEIQRYRNQVDELKAENELMRYQLSACAKELIAASDWICREVEGGTRSATHWAVRLKTNADQIDAATGKGEQS